MQRVISPEQELADCRKGLAALGYLSEGSVFHHKAGTAGSPYLWARKIQAKTVTVSLSKKQYQWLLPGSEPRAITAWPSNC